jgi:hypothetical protein
LGAYRYPERTMTQPAFALVHENGDSAVTARDQDGFFTPSETFWLIGCSNRPATALGNVELRVLDTAGDPIGAYFIGAATVTGSRPHPTDHSLIDIQLSGALPARPHPQAGAIWNRWRTSRPMALNEWALLPREAWLEVARLHHRWADRPDHPQRTDVSLDTTHLRDPIDFYCAMGEAVNGPGGYFGATLDGLHDCLRGGFGIAAPFDLGWPSPRGRAFQPIVEVLRDSGVRLLD